jgi:hypothetical protein
VSKARSDVATFLFYFLLLGAFTRVGMVGWNDASRLAQIDSIVARGTLAVDDSPFATTGDKFRYEGRSYSDKPPFLALSASPAYAVLRGLGISFEKAPKPAYFLVTWLCIGTIAAGGLVLLKRLLIREFGASESWANWVTLVTATGTLYFPYSIAFSNHAVSGVMLLAGFASLFAAHRKGELWHFAVAGLCFSLSGGVEVNCFLFLGLAGLVALRHSWKAAFSVSAGALPFVALYLALNVLTSGSMLPPALNASVWNYPGSVFNSTSLSGLTGPKGVAETLRYAFHMLLGNRGFFSHSPIMLAALLGLFGVSRSIAAKPSRFVYGVAVFGCVVFMSLCILRTNNYSGASFGVRWFATPIPLLALAMAGLERPFHASSRVRAGLLALGLASVLFSAIGSVMPFSLTEAAAKDLWPANTILLNLEFLADSSRFRLAHTLVGTVLLLGLNLYAWTKIAFQGQAELPEAEEPASAAILPRPAPANAAFDQLTD